jgi:RNA polymerase sigma-70 factor (ECF subfamily)
MEFETLAAEHKDAVYRQLIRVCGNQEDAEDALIEALLKAYRNLDQLHESSAFRAWLAQIGRRVCWQLKAREALLPIMQLSVVEEQGLEIADAGPDAEIQAARQQMKAILERAVEALPAAEREVYRMRDIDELSGKEVAERLGISVTAMKSRLHRARTGLRRSIDAALAKNQRRP